MNIRSLTVFAAALVISSAALAAPVKQGQSSLGAVLTDEKGMTLYTFDKDAPGMSACVDACAQNWPPLMAAGGAMAEGDYTVIKRADGSMQWAYKGKPLYTWAKDAKPGDTTGEGFKDIWHAAKP
ncbi:Orf21 putative lipoprotein [Paramagnetospirillum magnetotacticum MS-1]|uniref:Orf21 putative lipoprotein n=1 Tax=Paramagnetospirillum magnetotacticum MS-1 TaxID=272627 RepID=A0A0C2YG29_PARME|nr:lipoprotein [Paramagnetospirillum magnetotacticum]KIL98684.1 Orf21 putative lipoprotein [Paramagnetospirillum magnetotacticum MS-1]